MTTVIPPVSGLGADVPRASPADPRCSVLAGRRAVIDHMNGDHPDAGVEMCHHAFGVEPLAGTPTVVAATMDYVDRFGCDYAATTSNGIVNVRLGFERPVWSLEDVRGAIVTLLRAARTSS